MTAITFSVKPYKINNRTVLRFPKEESVKLPSRGQALVKGTVNNKDVLLVLEPDGIGSHWFMVEKELQDLAGVKAGETATLSVETSKDWPEPDVPADLQKAVDAKPQTRELWRKITPMARWDWIRWVNATSKDETRKHRIEVACSKMTHGERRPCCFNRSACCVPEVSKSGVLLDPTN